MTFGDTRGVISMFMPIDDDEEEEDDADDDVDTDDSFTASNFIRNIG